MKTKNQEMIQQFMDEGDYPNLFPIILKSKLTPLEKLTVSTMTNDIRMNGGVTWKHQTYADKLGSSRNVMINMFHKLIELGILIPNESNKAGGKSNTFTISFSSIEDYNPSPRKKPVTSSSKPVTSSLEKPVTSNPKPVTSSIHIKKPKENNKENNKESLKGEEPETSFYSFMEGANEDKPKDEMDIFLDNLDI